MCLKATVVDMRCPRPLEKEEGMVIHLLVAPVEAVEDGDVLAGVVMDKLGGVEVEVCRVEIVAFVKVRYTQAEVAQFVYGCGPPLEALGLVDVAVLLLGLFFITSFRQLYID